MNEDKINNIFKNFERLTALVIGDVMIDAYWWGQVNRISPEAPVPIVAVKKHENRLGGAGNVALNIQALGANPILCAISGDDNSADDLLMLLAEQGLSSEGVLRSKDRITTVKTRILGNQHQMLRIDSETEKDLNSDEELAFIELVKKLIQTKNPDVIIFEDYNKGLLTQFVIEEIIQEAKKMNIPISVDPKKKNFFCYRGVDLFKPNLKELKEGLNIEFDVKKNEELKSAIEKLRVAIDAKCVMVTLSEHGVIIKNDKEVFQYPAFLRNISDVSGAGDTVISVASLCLALKLNMSEIAQIANLSGGLVCEYVGVVPIDKKQLKSESIIHLTR